MAVYGIFGVTIDTQEDYISISYRKLDGQEITESGTISNPGPELAQLITEALETTLLDQGELVSSKPLPRSRHSI